jgi:hypothetical protein
MLSEQKGNELVKAMIKLFEEANADDPAQIAKIYLLWSSFGRQDSDYGMILKRKMFRDNPIVSKVLTASAERAGTWMDPDSLPPPGPGPKLDDIGQMMRNALDGLMVTREWEMTLSLDELYDLVMSGEVCFR